MTANIDQDFVSQLVSQLEQDAALLAALGQTADNPKIFGDLAQGQPVPPYLVITETQETPNYQGPSGDGVSWHFDRGTIVVTIIAPGKVQARRIGVLVQGQLDDAPIVPTDGILLELRQSGAAFVAIGDNAPNLSTVACRVIQFTYMIQRSS